MPRSLRPGAIDVLREPIVEEVERDAEPRSRCRRRAGGARTRRPATSRRRARGCRPRYPPDMRSARGPIRCWPGTDARAWGPRAGAQVRPAPPPPGPRAPPRPAGPGRPPGPGRLFGLRPQRDEQCGREHRGRVPLGAPWTVELKRRRPDPDRPRPRSPSAQRSSATWPARGAPSSFSIFIASSTTIVCPAFTASPTFTSTLISRPGIGERTVTGAAPAAARLGRGDRGPRARRSTSAATTRASRPGRRSRRPACRRARRPARRSARSRVAGSRRPLSACLTSTSTGCPSTRTPSSSMIDDAFLAVDANRQPALDGQRRLTTP